MAALLQGNERLRFPTIEKPRGSFRIDPSHPLAKDLAFFAVSDGPDLYDIVSGVAFPLSSGASPGAFAIGDGVTCTNATGAIGGGPSGWVPLATDKGDGTGALSLMLIAALNNTSSQHQAALIGDSTIPISCGFLANFTSSFATSSGRVCFDYGNNSSDNVVSIASAADNAPHVYVGTVSPGSQCKLYLDGVLPTQQTTGSDAALTLNLSTCGINFCSADGFGDTQLAKTIFAFAGFNRALDAAEVLGLSVDPYSLLSTQEGELPALFFVGGAPPPSGVSFRRTRSHLGTRINSRQVA